MPGRTQPNGILGHEVVPKVLCHTVNKLVSFLCHGFGVKQKNSYSYPDNSPFIIPVRNNSNTWPWVSLIQKKNKKTIEQLKIAHGSPQNVGIIAVWTHARAPSLVPPYLLGNAITLSHACLNCELSTNPRRENHLLRKLKMQVPVLWF